MYFDAWAALASAPHLLIAGRLMLAEAYLVHRVSPDRIAGMGIAGHALAVSMAVQSPQETHLIAGNDNPAPDQRYVYGLHGPRVPGKTSCVIGKKIHVVDDTGTSGNSLVTLIDMIEAEGGTVAHAQTLVDRSAGKIAELLGQRGIYYSLVYVLNESDRIIEPVM